MRLIDADELQMEPDENGMMNGVKFNMASRLKNRRYAIGLLKTMIDNAQTVDAEPVRHGKWIPDEYYYDNEIWKCSACGEEWCFEAGTPTENGANFCPQCGAKMDGD